MELTLTVVSYHRFTSDLEAKKTFHFNRESQSFLIGRSEHCDWCLPDPERVISGNHSRVESKDGELFIVDLSTNGLFINRSVEPLGKGIPCRLQLGDLMAMGDYEIEVSSLDLSNIVPNQVSNIENVSCSSSENLSQKQNINSDEVSGLNFVNKELENNIKPQKTDSPLPFFTGELEDNFEPPSQEVNQKNEQETLSIPEDWSAFLFDEKEDEAEGDNSIVISHQAPSEPSYAPARKEQHIDESTEKPNQPNLELMAFIRGLGISFNMAPAQNSEQWWFELGEAMHNMMIGLMNTLHHRSEFKQSHRLNHTLFKQCENNPLKFSATIEDAIHNLFNRNSTSFLTPEQAIKEAYSDIENHEKALLAGLDASVNGIMKLLSPDSIKERGEEPKFWQKMTLSNSNSNKWLTYELLYSRLEDEIIGNDSLFYWDEFAKAYEAHLKAAK